MSLSDISIRRPVLATVASLVIIVLGIASLLRLPVRELPDIDASVITVSVGYSGAVPSVIDTDVVEVIEGAVAGVSGVKSISSSSQRGRGRTVIEFIPGRDIDEAANDVRDAVSRVRGQLPDDVDEPRIYKNDNNNDPVMRLAVTSDAMTASQLTDFVERYIVDRLSTLDGVADVEIAGARSFAIRVWLDRRAMAARRLTVQDIEQALRRNNIDLPTGELTSIDREFTIRTDSRLSRVGQFQQMIISRVDGYPVRLSDIARVELGSEDDDTIVRLDHRQAVGLSVLRQSQSNTIAISDKVRKEIDSIRETLPQGMDIDIASDDATFISQSIHEVLNALSIAIGLVILVIFLFLASARATLVPAVTIPVSVIGTFIGVYALGFSINVLNLLALILAIGLVVDDAIVVLENIQRRVRAGESGVVAAFLGTRQVTFAVLATSVTLIAVFLPISFLEGQVGRLFSEFGFVLASSVVISTFVALTLCPALASRIIKREEHPSLFARIVDAVMGFVERGYRWLLRGALHVPLLVIVLAIMVGAASPLLLNVVPSELAPEEDRGVFFVPITAPQGSTVAYTDREVRKVEAMIDPLRDRGELTAAFALVGRGSGNRAFIVGRLADWSERERSQQEIVRSLIPKISGLIGARAFPVSPNGLGVRGSQSPLQVVIGASDYETAQTWGENLKLLAEDNPGLQNVDMDYEENAAQIDINIDRERADDLGITVEDISSTLRTMLASREITTYIDRGREYPVIVQAAAEDRRSPSDLANLFIRTGRGELVPLEALVSFSESAESPTLNRYNRLPSVTISASLADGYDLGAAIAFMQQAAVDALPPDVSMSFAGQSQVFLETSSGMIMVFAMAVLVVFLVLAGQFESFIHPIIIMLTVPLGTTGALLAIWLTGSTLNVYTEIGIVLLVGLMAKNGILIVEFANQLRDEGRGIREAVLEASALRLRPIIMTVISTVLGAVPLVLSSGAGSESRVAIASVIIGGLGLSTLLTLFVTPVLYDLLARFTRPAGAVTRELDEALAATHATRAGRQA
ncbi:MAG: efflux RND transporter permease subunit [Geminicoccaceae bacterium]|nr:efflux RND transporter permease subunit [Geminicoccaceae bacterium]MCB9944988.1 efflux RND transporter permease subunit [Geminicoccaceae bacterium]